jgi:hypothetical protein
MTRRFLRNDKGMTRRFLRNDKGMTRRFLRNDKGMTKKIRFNLPNPPHPFSHSYHTIPQSAIHIPKSQIYFLFLNNLKNYVLIFLFFRINRITFALIVEVVDTTIKTRKQPNKISVIRMILQQSFPNCNTHTIVFSFSMITEFL